MAWRVLVVDDDLSVGMALCEADTSIEIVEAKDVADALELAGTGRFDAIVCERALPDGDGLAFVRLSRAVSTTADVPIIVLTSDYDPSARAEVLAAGADGYLPKPVRPDALIAGLASAISRRRPRHLAAAAPITIAPPVNAAFVDPNRGRHADIAQLRTERDAANNRARRALAAADGAEAQLAEARVEREELAMELHDVMAQRDGLSAQIGGLLDALADARTEVTASRDAAAERESTIAELQLVVADLQREVEKQQKTIDLRASAQRAGGQRAPRRARGSST